MFLTTKLNLLSGMIIGASAVLLMKAMCKGRCNQKHDIDINTTPHQWSWSKILFPKKISRQKIYRMGHLG